MNTPTHLIFAAAVFAKPGQRKVTALALIGGLIPDFSLYFLFFWHQFVLGTPPRIIFDELYFSNNWQQIFAIDNSFILWGIGLGLGIYFRSKLAIVFCGAAVLHLLCDFPLHHDDARAHFWPITMWKFESPVSYWDPAHYGRTVASLEILFVIVLLAILWRRFKSLLPRVVLIIAGLITVAPFVVFDMIQPFG